MYFVKTFKAGGSDYDPRQKIWATYHCSLCNKDSYIDITRVIQSYDYSEERRCTHCHAINSEDKFINLKAQLDKLTTEKSRLQIEIDKIERELNEATKQVQKG
jgi:hypothetical protein